MSTLIHASVSPNILAKIDRRFTNRIDDLFVELFQNARRAGATHITVTAREVEPISPDFFRTEITVADNGSGIEDFSTLLRLGDSGWDRKVSEREDAAGEGFFSLVHSGVEVTSLKHQATFTKDSFMGHFPVEVIDMETSYPGTRLVFRRAETLEAVGYDARKIALYGHTPCSFNGVELPQEDFLKDALIVKEVKGVRIGVYTSYAQAGWNFHGRLLNRSIPSLDDVVVDAEGMAGHLYARFDVLETQSIWFKLPDRTNVVEDAKFHALMDEAKVAMYEYLATLPSHCARFSLYTEARALGVELNEASPWFKPFMVEPADSDTSSEVLPRDYALVLADLTASAIVDCVLSEDCDDGEVCYAFTFAVAVEYFEKLAVQPLLDDSWRYDGYSWYSAARRIHSFGLTIDGVDASEVAPSAELTLVDTIKLSFSLTNVEQPFNWALPFASWRKGNCSGDGLLMFATKTSPWAMQSKNESFDLVDAAFHVAFSFNDSGDGDSYGTQQGDFCDAYRREFLSVLGGDEAVLEAELSKALGSWPLSSLLDAAGIHQVQLTSKPDGRGWNVALTKAA
jgi:hypothetical protein